MIKTKEIVRAFVLTLWAVFFAHWLSGITGIEGLVAKFGVIGWIILFVYYCVFVFIGLKILEKI